MEKEKKEDREMPKKDVVTEIFCGKERNKDIYGKKESIE